MGVKRARKHPPRSRRKCISRSRAGPMRSQRWKHLDRTPPEPAKGRAETAAASQPPPEFVGAIAFLQGQQTIRGDPLPAGRFFGEAIEAFRSLPRSSIRADLITAGFIAQAVAFLAGGAFDAAQLAYSRLGAEDLSEAAREFARRLFELAGELRQVSPEECREAMAELIDLVERIEPEGRLDLALFLGS
jgi:hypothetical protein